MSFPDSLIELLEFRVGGQKDVFNKDDAIKCLKLSLATFNSIPPFSYISTNDIENLDQLSDVLVTYAGYIYLFSLSCKIKPTEITYVNNNGITLETTSVAGFMCKQSQLLYDNWSNMVFDIKNDDRFKEHFINEE